VTEAGVAEISNQLEFDDDTAYHAKLKIRQYARRLDPRPFCLTVSFTHPHDPYVTRQQYWDLYDHDKIPMPTVKAMNYDEQDPHSQRLYDAVDYTNFDVKENDIRNARHAYFANISYLDDKIGEILDVLDQCDFDDNTHIVLTADHGDMLGERGLWYKMNFFEWSARIPFLVAVASHDILPTLIDLAGGDSKHLAVPIDGHSVMGLIKHGEDEKRGAYAEYCAEGSVGPMVMIRRGDYKFIYCPADPIQLYDVNKDPHELSNLANDNEHLDTLNTFIDEMNKRWDFEKFTHEVKHSQKSRQLVDRANRKGKFSAWDYQPQIDAKERFMRNHLDLNVLEANNRYPKPE